MTRKFVLSFAFLALIAGPAGFAQQAPPTPPAAPQQGFPSKGMPHGMMMSGGPERGGMGIVPPGTWWKNPEVVTALSLTADQQKKLDDTFLQSRIGLIHLHASLEEEQLKLEPLLNANPPDQAKSLAQISKIADLRADLEKSNAKMLLSLRGVLTADQWTKLQAEQRSRHERPGREDRGEKHGPGPRPGPQGPGPQSSAAPQGLDMPLASTAVQANQ